MFSALEKITYHPALGRVIRAVGLRPAARRLYYAVVGNKHIQVIKIGRLSAQFRTYGPLEFRTVRGSVLGERALLQDLVSELRRDDVFLDVGANLGLFSIFAAQRCGTVLACEPEPIAFERLQFNVRLNRLLNVQCLNVALSDRVGTGHISQQPEDKTIQDAHLGDAGTPVTVLRGDQLRVLPTVLKLDVEGHEISVIRGMGTSLSNTRIVICEVHTNLGIAVADVERTLSENSGQWVFRSCRRHEQVHLIATRA